MTVGELLGGGWMAITRRPKELAIWSAIQLLISVAFTAAFIPYMTAMMQAQQQSLTAGAPTVPTLPAGMGVFFLAYVLILVWLLMLFTAVVRASSSNGEDTFAWLRFAGDELRLIGLGLLYIVAWIVLGTLLALLLSALIAALALGSPGAAIVVGIVFGIACFGVAVWLGVRMSLIGAVFVLERSFALRKGWQATKGHFWTLFLAYLVMSVAFIVLEVIIVAITSPGVFGNMASGGDPAQAIQRQQEMLASFTSPSIGMIIIWVVGTIVGTAAMVYYFGVIATAAVSATGYSKQDLEELGSHFE